MSWDPFIKLIGDTGPTGTFQFNGATNSILFFDGNQVTGTTEFTYIPGPSGSVSLQGDFLPTQDAVYNLGSTGLRWGEIHVGHGTINIAGPSGSSAVGTIGTDANSIVYTKNGFASPFINIGPSIDSLDPGAIGGWVVGPTGTFGQDDYDLIVQQKLEGQAFPAGVTGPTYSLIKRFGSTGSTGPAGSNGISGGLTLYLDTAGGVSPNNGTISTTPIISTQTSITSGDHSNTNDYLMGTFTSPTNFFTSTTIIVGTWDLNLYASASHQGDVTMYCSLFYVDADGSSNPVSIVNGTSGSATTITTSIDAHSYTLFVPTTILPDLTKRLQIKVYANFSGNNRNTTLYFRDSTICHMHTTLSQSPGSTGPTGSNGIQGVTGPTGPASSGKICQAKLTSDQTITSGDPNKTILFVDDIDPNNWWDATNHRFQPNISGYYLISVFVWWKQGSLSSAQTNIQLTDQNNSQVGIAQAPVTTSTGNTLSITKIMYFNGSTNYVYATAYTGNTTSQDILASGCWFTAALQ